MFGEGVTQESALAGVSAQLTRFLSGRCRDWQGGLLDARFQALCRDIVATLDSSTQRPAPTTTGLHELASLVMVHDPAGLDGTVQVCALDLRELLNLARRRVTRPLAAEGRRRYFQSETCLPLP